MRTLGYRIQARLKELGKSQYWLADAVGMKQPSINAIIKNPEAGSKHIVKIAAALGLHAIWLAEEKGPKLVGGGAEALLIGKVGAGAEINRFESPDVLAGIPVPPGLGAVNAAEISGDSQYPLQEGWIIFYGPENQGISTDSLGRLCVVQVKDGPTLLKTLKRGSRKGLYRLESWNAPPREDERIEWATKVLDIRPN